MRVLLLCLLILLLCTASFAAADTQPKTTTDPRLLQLVTIECTGMRLHSVCEQISAKTGVTVRCGKTKDDWQVRDLPVFVAVKDITLRKLLSAIVDCTHTTLVIEQVGDSRYYRVIQSIRQAKELESYFHECEAVPSKAAAWDWDALSRAKNVASDELEGRRQDAAIILDGLGSKARDQVIAGHAIDLKFGEASGQIQAAMRDAAIKTWHLQRDFVPDPEHKLPTEPTAEDISNPAIRIGYTPPDGLKPSSLWMSIDTGSDENPYTGGIPLSYAMGEGWDYKRVGMDVARPVMPKMPGADWPSHPADRPPRKQWYLPLWKQKVKLDPWKEERSPVYADILVDIARVMNLQIVAEDFSSHCADNGCIAGVFGKEGVVEELLEMAQIQGMCGHYWYMDEKTGVLVGCSSAWPEQHACLIPESLYLSLCEKGNNDGIGFDDWLVLSSLSTDQFDTWIVKSRDLNYLSYWMSYRQAPDRPMWQLYQGLSASDRARAVSSDGLPLAALDADVVKHALKARLYEMTPAGRQATGDCPEAKLVNDPDAAKSAVLKLLQYRRNGLSDYRLQISNNSGLLIQVNDAPLFPVYSPSREAELAKAAAAKATPAAAK